MLPTPTSSQDSGKSDKSLSDRETPDHSMLSYTHSLPAPEETEGNVGPTDFSHLRRSARQPRRLNYNEADEKLDEIVEAEMKKDDLDGIPENLKIVTPLDLDAWQKVDYQSYLVKREIKIGNNARVEKWNLDEFRDWVLRHSDCENRQNYSLSIQITFACLVP